MFFYLSFLRQLPRISNTSTPPSITPQIANDLRTLYLEESPDIFYTWVSSLSDCLSPSSSSTARKLTTWRTSSMYKALSLPFPPTAKPGQGWRLCVSCGNPRPRFVIDLNAEDFGSVPFPAISMPVLLNQKGGKVQSMDKQEQIERLYSISYSPRGEQLDRTFCIREQTSFDLDKKIWDSGLGLGSWLAKLLSGPEPTSNPTNQLKKLLTKENQLKIVELGAGTGIVSICLATLLDCIGIDHPVGRHIYATDLPSAMELIEHNVTTNKHLYPTVDLEAGVLDWDEEDLPPKAQEKLDLIVMADVTYNTASFPSLVRTLQRIVGSTSSLSPSDQGPSILLAYKQRDPSERELWPMLEEIGISLTRIDQVMGKGAEEVEIWVANCG